MPTMRLSGEVVKAMRPYSGRFGLAIGEVLAIGALEVLKPWPLKIVIDNVLAGKPAQTAFLSKLGRDDLLLTACGGLVVLYVTLAVLQVTNNYLTISIGQRMVNDLRSRLFEHLQRLSLSFHRRREVGDGFGRADLQRAADRLQLRRAGVEQLAAERRAEQQRGADRRRFQAGGA